MRQWQDILTAATPPHLPDAEASSKLIQAKPGAAKNVLSVCTLMKDRARYLREWLQYHLLVGVEHFYLYDHGSVDGLAEELQLGARDREHTPHSVDIIALAPQKITKPILRRGQIDVAGDSYTEARH